MWRLLPSLALVLVAATQAPAEGKGDSRFRSVELEGTDPVGMERADSSPLQRADSLTLQRAELLSLPRGHFVGWQHPDSSELHDRARRLQDRFESLRRRAMPRTGRSNPWRECDEVVGRFCLFFGGESDWEPVPDSPEVLQARGDLLDSLTVIASEIPGDGWVVGQLVQYLGEEGRWGEALDWVADCSQWERATQVVSSFARARPGWWCHALQGFVLHRSDRYGAALESFEDALSRMHPDRRERWLNPDPLLDREADDVWDDAEETERNAVRRRLWALSDPLYLLEGNDRLTEHYARHTVSWIREDAENPYGMSWGWDLEELVVRYGPEMGWNRTTTSAGSLRPPNVVGHHHPESRHFLPPGRALADPASFEEAGWGADPDDEGGAGAEQPATAYAPPYAPDLRFEPYQVARFRRDEEMIVVAGYRLPADTAADRRMREGRDGPDRATGMDGREPDAPGDVRARLFLFDSPEGLDSPDGVEPLGAGEAGAGPERIGDAETGAVGTYRRGPERGVLRARLPMGEYLASVEVWDSARARAGRSRRGIRLDALPPDVAAISDLLILDPPTGDANESPTVASPSDSAEAPAYRPPTSGLPQDLESAIPLVRPLARMCPGEEVAVGWELTGIGFRRDPVAFALRMEKTDRGFFSRVGDFLGLSSPPEPVTVEWTEEGPDEPRPFFRSVGLALPPELESGVYRLTLEARLPGRDPLEMVRRVDVPEAGECESSDSG